MDYLKLGGKPFLAVVQGGGALHVARPIGIVNEQVFVRCGGNYCYQNTVLSCLAASKNFNAFVQSFDGASKREKWLRALLAAMASRDSKEVKRVVNVSIWHFFVFHVCSVLLFLHSFAAVYITYISIKQTMFVCPQDFRRSKDEGLMLNHNDYEPGLQHDAALFMATLLDHFTPRARGGAALRRDGASHAGDLAPGPTTISHVLATVYAGCTSCGGAAEGLSTHASSAININMNELVDKELAFEKGAGPGGGGGAVVLSAELLVKSQEAKDEGSCPACGSDVPIRVARPVSVLSHPDTLVITVTQVSFAGGKVRPGQEIVGTKLQSTLIPAASLGHFGKVYTLKSFGVHRGQKANMGHYISYTYDDQEGRWLKIDDNKVTPIDPDSIANGVPIIHDFSKGGHESVPFLVYELDGDSSDTTSEGELSERLKQEVESMFEKRQEEQAKEEEERRKREEEEEERRERVRAARALARRLEQEAEVARQVADNAERGGGPVDFDELERGVGMEVDVAGSLPHGASADSFAAEGAGAEPRK